MNTLLANMLLKLTNLSDGGCYFDELPNSPNILMQNCMTTGRKNDDLILRVSG